MKSFMSSSTSSTLKTMAAFCVFCCFVVLIVGAQQETRPRKIRGFKNAALSTARGFGKRDFRYPAHVNPELTPYEPYLAPYPAKFDSIPIDLFVDHLLANPKLTRILTQQCLDKDEDGVLSSEEIISRFGNIN